MARLLGPDGRPVEIDDLPDDATVVVHKAEVDVIPTVVHGFKVSHAMGPYPIDAPNSHRKAIYVELWPIEPDAMALMTHLNRQRIHSCTPLTPTGAAAIEADPMGLTAEQAVLDTLRAAIRELRKYLPVKRQEFERRSR